MCICGIYLKPVLSIPYKIGPKVTIFSRKEEVLIVFAESRPLVTKVGANPAILS